MCVYILCRFFPLLPISVKYLPREMFIANKLYSWQEKLTFLALNNSNSVSYILKLIFPGKTKTKTNIVPLRSC